MLLYRSKVLRSDNLALHHHIEVKRYGHCKFNYQSEVKDVLKTLVDMIDNPPAHIPASRVFIPVMTVNPSIMVNE
jgi:hypothetical protein